MPRPLPDLPPFTHHTVPKQAAVNLARYTISALVILRRRRRRRRRREGCPQCEGKESAATPRVLFCSQLESFKGLCFPAVVPTGLHLREPPLFTAYLLGSLDQLPTCLAPDQAVSLDSPVYPPATCPEHHQAPTRRLSRLIMCGKFAERIAARQLTAATPVQRLPWLPGHGEH